MAAYKEPSGDKNGYELYAEIKNAGLKIKQIEPHARSSFNHISKVLNQKLPLTMKTQKDIEQAIVKAKAEEEKSE